MRGQRGNRWAPDEREDRWAPDGGRTDGHPMGGRTAGHAFFPPIIFGAAKGLGNAVHRLAEGNGDLLVLATVLVLPRGNQQQLAFCTLVDAFC